MDCDEVAGAAGVRMGIELNTIVDNSFEAQN